MSETNEFILPYASYFNLKDTILDLLWQLVLIKRKYCVKEVKMQVLKFKLVNHGVYYLRTMNQICWHRINN